MLRRDALFLLTPDFEDASKGAGAFFCPETALVEGMLAFYPRLRAEIDVHYIGFRKPRAAIVALLGEQVQSCPILVLSDESVLKFTGRPDVTLGESNGRPYIRKDVEICRYLATRYGAGEPHP
jgi:hypothetical protein